MIVAHVGQTRNSAACCELWDEREGQHPTCILKAYPDASGAKINITLPELTTFRQTKIDPDNRRIIFERKT